MIRCPLSGAPVTLSADSSAANTMEAVPCVGYGGVGWGAGGGGLSVGG